MPASESLPPALLESVRTALVRRGVTLEPGLSNAEIAAIQALGGFTIPTDLRSWLQFVLPQGEPFPAWRDNPENEILRGGDGVARDIVNARGAWLNSWGPRPDSAQQRLEALNERLKSAPPLFRLYAHRYMPLRPPTSGNPVFSIWQGTDAIYYGTDLADYLKREFLDAKTGHGSQGPRAVEFWDGILQANDAAPGSARWAWYGDRPSSGTDRA